MNWNWKGKFCSNYIISDLEIANKKLPSVPFQILQLLVCDAANAEHEVIFECFWILAIAGETVKLWPGIVNALFTQLLDRILAEEGSTKFETVTTASKSHDPQWHSHTCSQCSSPFFFSLVCLFSSSPFIPFFPPSLVAKSYQFCHLNH